MVMRRRMLLSNRKSSPSLTLRYNWDLTTGSIIDSVNGLSLQYRDCSFVTEGIKMNNANAHIFCGADVFPPNSTLEVDFVSTESAIGSSNGRLITMDGGSNPGLNSNAATGFIRRGNSQRWGMYKQGTWTMSNYSYVNNLFSGKKLTCKYYYSEDTTKYVTEIWADEELIQRYSSSTKWNNTHDPLGIGCSSNAYFYATISHIRIYNGVEL